MRAHAAHQPGRGCGADLPMNGSRLLRQQTGLREPSRTMPSFVLFAHVFDLVLRGVLDPRSRIRDRHTRLAIHDTGYTDMEVVCSSRIFPRQYLLGCLRPQKSSGSALWLCASRMIRSNFATQSTRHTRRHTYAAFQAGSIRCKLVQGPSPTASATRGPVHTVDTRPNVAGVDTKSRASKRSTRRKIDVWNE